MTFINQTKIIMGIRCRWQTIGREDYTERCDPLPQSVLDIYARCEIENYDKNSSKVSSFKWHKVTLDGEILGWVKYHFYRQFATKTLPCTTDEAMVAFFWHTSDPPFAKGVELLLENP